MVWRPRLLCCLFLSLSLPGLARAATVHQEWEISYQFKSPDCVRKLAVTINRQTPGPTIRATQGDTVVVRVKNSLLTENVAIHWHGIRQIGTPWADGTEAVTQCPILPGDTLTYNFVVDDRPGTYMYHAHYGMQRSAGLNGVIVVAAAPGCGPDAEPLRYDGEHHVLLNDWWHKSTYEQATGLASVPFGWVGEPQSLLINGRGRFVNCSTMAVGACNATLPESAAPVFAVVPGKTYRFRIASMTSLSALNFEIEDRNAGLIGCPAPAVHSGSRSSRHPPMGYLQYGAALVVVMLFVEFFCYPLLSHRASCRRPEPRDRRGHRRKVRSCAQHVGQPANWRRPCSSPKPSIGEFTEQW
ncbi:L-ascorbate oxidase-like [Miscanthus floridulus]|uniref:L-ascorbate oxidase-like n=1 Tax=Miscanthus floridulus TaxID=154761 RepID=UPI0034583B3A